MDADGPATATVTAAAASTPPTPDNAFVDAPDTLPSPHPAPLTTSSSTLRRRPRRAKIPKEPDQPPSPSASAASAVTAADEPVKAKPESSEATSAASTVTAADEPDKAEPESSEATSAAPRPPPPPEEEADNKDSPAARDYRPPAARDYRPTAAPPGVLESLATLVIKAVVFQVSALVSCLMFPARLLQWWYLLVTDPLGLARRAHGWALGAAGQAAGVLTARLGGGEAAGPVAGRLAWGSLWAVYVCVVLCALLVMAFLGGGLLVGRMVEEPVQVTETLNFDYTKPNPVAFVPVRRFVPLHQRMQLEVSLTLPESDYNRRLGVFQVIRLKMRGIKEAFEPITGVRILLEQRAEFSPGAGIPEIYAASLLLEAELPLYKRILWNWRWTLFVWSSMGFFVFELLLAVVCCRPRIFPRGGHSVVAP